MQLTNLATLSLFGLALARPQHHRRTAATIESDLATVSTDLTAFDKDINAFTGSLLQALALLSAYDTLASAVTTTTSDVTSTGTLDASDSATIYTTLESLTTQITTTLSDAVAKVGVPTEDHVVFMCPRVFARSRSSSLLRKMLLTITSVSQYSVVESAGYASDVCDALASLYVSQTPPGPATGLIQGYELIFDNTDADRLRCSVRSF